MSYNTAKQLINPAIRAASVHVRSSTLPKDLIKSSSSFLSNTPTGGKIVLPDLPYDYNALEPVISAETMRIHHTKHHNTYVTNLNTCLEKLDSAVSESNVSSIITLQNALNFNGGGHINHCLFWENLCPRHDFESSSIEEGGPLQAAINNRFQSFDNMKAVLIQKTVAIQGSGWGWLALNTDTNTLQVATTKNQDPLLATTGLVPLLGIDVWEHAYYVDYRNVRLDYLNKIMDIINWDVVDKRFKLSGIMKAL